MRQRHWSISISTRLYERMLAHAQKHDISLPSIVEQATARYIGVVEPETRHKRRYRGQR